MNRIVLFLIILISLSIANDCPKKLIIDSTKYIKNINKKNAKKAYDFMAPYFKYLNDFSDFKAYVNMFKEIENFNMLKCEVIDKDIYDVTYEILYEDMDRNVTKKYRWIKVGSKYYTIIPKSKVFNIFKY